MRCSYVFTSVLHLRKLRLGKFDKVPRSHSQIWVEMQVCAPTYSQTTQLLQGTVLGYHSSAKCVLELTDQSLLYILRVLDLLSS